MEIVERELESEFHEEGYHEYTFKEEVTPLGFKVTFGRMTDTKEGTWAEVSVYRVFFGQDSDDRQVFGPVRQNLLASTWRNNILKPLKEADPDTDYGWEDILQDTISTTMRHHRGVVQSSTFDQWERPEEETAFVLEPYVAASGVSVLFGAGSTGKSTIAAAMALSVASGQPILNTFPKIRGPVLWADYETDNVELFERVEAMLKGEGLKASDIEHPIIHYPLLSRITHIQQELREEVMKTKAVMVVLDSVGQARGGDANAAEDTIRLFRALRYLRVPVLAIDHVTKEDVRDDETLTPYGSVYTINSGRLLWGISLDEEASDLPAVRQLNMVNTKANRTALQRKRGVELTMLSNPESHLIERIEIKPNNGKWKDKPGTARTAYDDLIDLMASAPYTYWTLEEIAQQLGKSRAAVEKLVQRYADNFVVVKRGRANAYRNKSVVGDELALGVVGSQTTPTGMGEEL